MKVALTCFEPCDPFGSLTDDVPVAMLPILNRPIIEHVIEQCLDAGLGPIRVAVVELPRPVRQFLGQGERWGVDIEISTFKDACSNERALQKLAGDEPCLIVPAEALIDLDLTELMEFHKKKGNKCTRALAYKKDSTPQERFSERESGARPLGDPVDTGIMVAHPPFEDLLSIDDFVFDGDWIRVQNPAQLWEANQAAVRGRFPRLRKMAARQEGDKWFGHHCVIHPLASIGEPVFIGNHTRLGPGCEILDGAVIGDGVIVDSQATVKSSLVMDHTYVGANTNVEERIVRGKLIVNIRTGNAMEVVDPIILGGARDKTLRPWAGRIVDSLVACLLFCLTCPVWATKGLMRSFKGKTFFHKKTFLLVNTRAARSVPGTPIRVRLRSFDGAGAFTSRLPGLLDVMAGHLALVGPRPLTESERAGLEADWAKPRDSAPEGLFTPVDAEGIPEATDDEKIIVENFYVGARSVMGDIRVLIKSILNLIRTRGRTSNGSGSQADQTSPAEYVE